MLRTLLQIIAFCFPSPINLWIHRIYGAAIDKHVSMHPGVLIIVKKLKIGADTKIRFGTFIRARTFEVGKKSLMGYFLLVKGLSDLIIGDACVVGPKVMINCDCPVKLGYYAGIGPGSTLFTHGSLLPVTQGYRTMFGPIELKDKAWATMNAIIGPGVTIGRGSIALPGTVLLESVGEERLVSGNPAKFRNVPLLKRYKSKNLEDLGSEILNEYSKWSKEFNGANYQFVNGALNISQKGQNLKVTVNGSGDIVLLTKEGAVHHGMFFNLADLKTDSGRHPEKLKMDEFMRLYYGLTFL